MPSSASSSNNQSRILLAFACVYLFWGGTYLAMRAGVQVLPPFVLATVRYCIAGPLLLLLCVLRGDRIRLHSLREVRQLAVIGILMLVGGNTTVIWAEQYLPSGLAALVVATIPLYAALIEVIRPRGEGLRMRGWIGIATGFFGLCFLLWPRLRIGLGGDRHVLAAALVLLGGTFCWTLASVISRRTMLRVSGMTAAGWEMVFAGLANACILGATRGWHGAHWGLQAAASIFYLVVFGSLITYTAYIYLLDHVAVSKVATYSYVNPVIAVMLGAVFLGERFAGIEWVGIAGILLAVFLITSSRARTAIVVES